MTNHKIKNKAKGLNKNQSYKVIKKMKKTKRLKLTHLSNSQTNHFFFSKTALLN